MSTRILFVVFSEAGHINPMIAIAQHLEQAGHDVIIVSVQDDVSARCKRAGLRAECHGVSASRPRKAQRSVQLAKRLTNPAWAVRWAATVLLEGVPDQVSVLRKLIARHQPNAVVVDASSYAGAIAAELEGVRWATVATGLQGFGDSVLSDADLVAQRTALIEPMVRGLEFRAADVISPALDIVLTAEGLVPVDTPVGPNFVGAALPLAVRGDEPAFPWEALPTDRPIVYVSFGSWISHGSEVFEAIAGALSADEAFFVMVVKDLLEEPFVRALPRHVLAVAYAPQLAILDRASVVICHGGGNTVMESLSRELPTVVMPLAYDQPVWARVVERAGVGRGLDAKAITAESVRSLILPLLDADAPERIRARALGERVRGGAERAASLVIQLAESQEASR